ncbi:DUF4136 domain-containing protein [Agriterribacter sp.]|uniref:DUF4136 domain-containing protein n=1 Tax=Agriterribacter sp. TaxID=2821509 RepID=UPI002B6D18C9|nr:DUF4136 domain-containing protein [Agriterribacter sp.]HRP54940.1 DUF4136 domain-containing protein [Agriterribacter sp.]
MKPNKIYMALTAGVVCIGLLGSCTKDPLKNMTNEESRIYITNYDSTVNFEAFKTYSISDSVAVVSNGSLREKTLTETDAAFLQAIKDNMQQRGYELVGKDDHPDLGINISSVFNGQTGVISYPSYWGYYNRYWDPYYWGYGGYDYYFPYTSYAIYQIREGALSIDMVDLKDANSNKKIEGVWNGLIRGEAIFNASTAASQVKALFDQSPYIKNNQ